MADHILVPSMAVKAQMTTRDIPEHRVIHIPYGVDLTKFAPSLEPPRRVLNRVPRVLFVGQVSFRKGIPLLLAAARNLNVEVTVAGPVLHRSFHRHLPDNVRFLGSIDRAGVLSLMQSHDAFVLPTIEDACALVIAEAAASGLPVITTWANGAAELLPRQYCQQIAPGSVSALREALSSVAVLEHEERLQVALQVRDTQVTRVVDWTVYSSLVLEGLFGQYHRA